MKLAALIEGLKLVSMTGLADVEIKGVSYDSRQIKPGFLFMAVKGQNQDGNRFARNAVDQGAVAILTEETPAVDTASIAVLRVNDVRQAMASVAAKFYHDPSSALTMVGITGTNGKTTTAFMIRDMLTAAGRRSGLIGTVQYEIGERIIPAGRTTPESVDLQNMLDQMVHVGCAYAVMEVSSHALAQKRVWGIRYNVCVFTNLTQDHLDYHETIPQYFQAKSLLFSQDCVRKKDAISVINLDDPWGQALMKMDMPGGGTVTYGFNADAMVKAERINLTSHGSEVNVASPWGRVTLNLKLLGRFNVSNALAAFSVGGAMGLHPSLMAQALSQMQTVPGRLEQAPAQEGVQVFVDYAHTHDALQNVLSTLKEIAPRRVIVVFGCGGNRDRKKRPLMGAVARKLADEVIVTSDNPRKESPPDIIAEILAGIQDRDHVTVIEDRREAIRGALAMARKGDIVLIAGKGHEKYQEFTNTVLPFDDRQVVRECVEAMK